MFRKVGGSIFCIITLILTGNISAVTYLDDNFEHYAENSDLAMKWGMVTTGGDSTFQPQTVSMANSLSADQGSAGSRAMRLDFSFDRGVVPLYEHPDRNLSLGKNWEPSIYGMISYFPDDNEQTDLSNYTGIRLWIKPGTIAGDAIYFALSLTEDVTHGSEKWMSPKVTLNTLDANGEYIYFDFADFREYFTGSGEPMDRSGMITPSLWLAYDDTASQNSSATVWVDDIQLMNNSASNPIPPDGALIMELTPTLTWTPGDNANAHDVYLGSDRVAVTEADTTDPAGIYRGRQDSVANHYSPCCLEPGVTYYWRIDEVNAANIQRGKVWSFTVQDPTQTYSNPVIPEIGPADPTVIFYQGQYYLYPTGDNSSYRVYTSFDLVNWTRGPKVFIPGGINVWAPDVSYNAEDGKFYLYYTANWKIGVAVADKPDGTFINEGVLIYNAIDANMFLDDDGKRYLYYVRTDLPGGFKIFVQEMANPLELTGTGKLIIEPTERWERNGSITEGPWMIKHDNVYYLLYSGSAANTLYYAVGYATADNPLGPFTKYSGNPIIKGGNGIYGPGHGSVISDAAGQLWHVYHQKRGPIPDWDRYICIDPLWFDSTGVLHGKATRGTPEPAPAVALPIDDDFENYNSDNTLALGWKQVLWSGNNVDSATQVSMTRTLDGSGGAHASKAMKLVFTFNEGVAPSTDTTAANWTPAIFGATGKRLDVRGINITDYVGIKLWLKPGEMTGNNIYFKMSMIEGDGERWMSPKIDPRSLNPGGEEVYFPFGDFEEYFTGSGQAMDKTNITTIFLWLAYDDTATANSSATVWVDNIKPETAAVSVESDLSVMPDKFALYQNYPNPFNPVTTIRYDLPVASHVRLVIYDILGREVIQLVNAPLYSGRHSVQWNGRDKYGKEVAGGVYIYRIETNNFVTAKKLVLLK